MARPELVTLRVELPQGLADGIGGGLGVGGIDLEADELLGDRSVGADSEGLDVGVFGGARLGGGGFEVVFTGRLDLGHRPGGAEKLEGGNCDGRCD